MIFHVCFPPGAAVSSWAFCHLQIGSGSGSSRQSSLLGGRIRFRAEVLAEALPGEAGGVPAGCRGTCLDLTLAAMSTWLPPWALARRDMVLGRGVSADSSAEGVAQPCRHCLSPSSSERPVLICEMTERLPAFRIVRCLVLPPALACGVIWTLPTHLFSCAWEQPAGQGRGCEVTDFIPPCYSLVKCVK